MTSKSFDPVLWVRSHFQKRKASNSAYSLRAFARDIGVPSGRLSELLARKRPLTFKTFCNIVLKVEADTTKVQEILEAMKGEVSRPRDAKLLTETLVNADQFATIADWQHYAILSLMNTNGFRADTKWIGKRLGIDPVTARDALERLERVGLIEKSGTSFQRCYPKVVTSDDIVSQALRRSHRQSIENAVRSLDDVPVDLREICSITMAIDPSKIQPGPEIFSRLTTTSTFPDAPSSHCT